MNILLFAFLGGAILNLMPCVFPVLGIKVLGFVDQAGSDKRAIRRHGLVYTLGVLLTFLLLATILAVLRAGGAGLGWGFQLQSPAFVYALSLLMLVFALNLSGVFEMGARATTIGSALHSRSGYAGSFFSGVLATVVATPCSAPFLAPALGSALAMPLLQSYGVFTAIALGLSSPYLLLSMWPALVHHLPKPGRWMETLKQALAFPLYASAAYLLWVLAGQIPPNGLLAALFGAVLIAMACWLYGRYATSVSVPRRPWLAWAGGALLALCGVGLGWPQSAAPEEVVWTPWSDEAVASLTAAGRPVYVDFTARWCATCQANKKVVFTSDEVRRYFARHHVAALKADWTNADARITEALARWHRSAVPFNLVYGPGAAQPVVLPEVLTPGIVLRAFKEAPPPVH